MASVKQCYQCGKTQSVTEFSKRKASRDGLQNKCKTCNKVDNKKFREEKPEHHAIWQSNNRELAKEYVLKYRRGDKSGKIYFIQNPIGEFYIGMTNTHFNIRIIEHRTKFKRWSEGKGDYLCPLLFASFAKYGFENHKVGVIIEDEKASRQQLRQWESEAIKFFMNKGISLNKQQ